MSKKILLILLFSLLLPLILCTKVNAATLNKAIITGPSSIDLYDNTKSVTATGKDRSNNTIPNNKLKISFSSSDTSIATVNASTGRITTKKLGKVTITATIKKGLFTIRSAKLNINIVPKKLSDFGKVDITETTKTISSKWNESNPYLKTSNNTWCLNFYGYDGVSMKSNGTKYENGAVALYTIQGIRNMSPNKNYLTTGTKANSTYFVKDSGTNFKIIGYKYAPNYDTYQKFLQAIYNEILAGYPVAINVYNSANQPIYIVGYAVNSTKIRTKGKLSASDIHVIDTSSGQWKKLSDFRESKRDGKYVLGIHDSSNSTVTADYTYDFGGNTYKLAMKKTKLTEILNVINSKTLKQRSYNWGNCFRFAAVHCAMLNGTISTSSVTLDMCRNERTQKSYISNTSNTEFLKKLKKSIDDKTAHTLYVTSSTGQHWVTVVGYKGNGTSLSDYLILGSSFGKLEIGGTGESCNGLRKNSAYGGYRANRY